MVDQEEYKKLEKQFRSIFGSAGTKEQLELYIKMNKREEVVLPQACRIDDPECLSCGS